jgi:hypothetical protein
MRHGDPLGGDHRPYKAKRRIVDALVLDGGWLTLEGIRLLLPDAAVRTIENHLRTLVAAGKVEGRSVGMGTRDHGQRKGEVETRAEWRAV